VSNILSNLQFQLFKKYIKEKCGIDISDDKAYLIETRLSKLLVDSHLNSFDELYASIINSKDPYMSEKIIDAITTNETLWFRDKSPWITIEDVLLPKYIEQLRNKTKSKIRIWSAAASTGQEAYSTAMCIHNFLEKKGIRDITLSDFEIVATDISNTVLEIGKKGRYDPISIMRGLDPLLKQKYFKKEGMAFEIDEKIKSIVTFKHFNLQNSFMLLGKFDIIFCRYVLIYFSDDLTKDIINKLLGTINTDGALFIGSSELYSVLDTFFKMEHYSNATYYRRR